MRDEPSGCPFVVPPGSRTIKPAGEPVGGQSRPPEPMRTGSAPRLRNDHADTDEITGEDTRPPRVYGSRMRASQPLRRASSLVIAVLSFGACDSDRQGQQSTDDLEQPMLPQPPECDPDGPCVNECMSNAECDGEEICVANFDPQQGGIGVFECREPTRCVPLDDDVQWCGDASACCDPSAICTSRGYCILPPDSAGSTTGGSGTSESSGTDTTGTGTEAGSSSSGNSTDGDG